MDLKKMTDEQLQDLENQINDEQAARAAAAPDPINAERERVLKGIAGFIKKFGESKTLMDMWK